MQRRYHRGLAVYLLISLPNSIEAFDDAIKSNFWLEMIIDQYRCRFFTVLVLKIFREIVT